MPISKTIKRIKIGEKKVVLIFDNGDKLEISPNTYTEYHFFEGKPLSNKEINEIKSRNDLDKYISYATKLLGQRSYTKHKIKEKLIKKGANEEQVEQVIEILVKYQLIDDKEIIKEFLEYADYRHYGFNRIKEELFKKGISSIYIDKIKYDETRENKHASILIKEYEKKYSKYNYAKLKEHCYQGLLRMGYSFEVASEALNKLSPIDEKKELELLKVDYKKAKEKYSKNCSGYELKEKITNSLIQKGYRYSDLNKIKEN